MIAHAVGLIVTVAVIIFCTLPPFLPGGYDPLAVPMSAMAQTFGGVGRLLVPIGVMWFASRDSTGLARIVMFNPRDEHEMTSHDSDLLRRSPEQLQFRRGYYAVHDAPQPHWKYFWFD